VFPLRKFLWRI